MTLAEENYLKSIFHLGEKLEGEVSTNAIAENMNTQPSSVTDMLQKLAEKRLCVYKKYKGVQLTEKGKKAAVKIIRKHRLWETFLVTKLKFNWDEVHEIAEQLEHIQSDELIERMNTFLDFPTMDPHGDPIPDANGYFHKKKRELLSNTEIGIEVVCVGVKDSHSELLKYLDKKSIHIGTLITILTKEFDGSLEIKVGLEVFSISKLVAENLFVE
ncbi:MAG: metal-dependent transcriptional regulator [Chitinophagales bacterium]|nr:metal-dependent transcriptional regulator [Chitinophagales bacterium]